MKTKALRFGQILAHHEVEISYLKSPAAMGKRPLAAMFGFRSNESRIGKQASANSYEGAFSKPCHSERLGQKKVSGQLVIRQLVADGIGEQTYPEKPQSRLQRYRLTEKGRERIFNGCGKKLVTRLVTRFLNLGFCEIR